MTRPGRSGRRAAYKRVEEESSKPPLLEESSGEDEEMINVIILDPAHTRFTVPAHPDWSLGEFKEHGAAVHKVPVKSQRLIKTGKMLTDNDMTLKQFGIEDGTLLHLFPKPNVVTSGEEVEPDEGGAHVPRIVLDPEEAERRSNILVLSSDEIFEAQHRIKLLCLLLLIISSMELLTLVTIALGVEEEPTDDSVPPAGQPTDPSQHDPTLREWRNSDYFDLIISGYCLYVSLLGIKATTENTLWLAKNYLCGTVVAGMSWIAYYYYLNVRAGQDADDGRDNADIYTQALFALILPICIWVLCCVRAYEFHNLLAEAEQEAEERNRADEEAQVEHEQELALQEEGAAIT